MKNLILGTLLLAGTTLFAQKISPDFEQEDTVIKGTFYYEDGAVKQEGTYKNGKLHGQWVMYAPDGSKMAIAHYKKGKKVGQWFYYQDQDLTQINYTDNRIAEVSQWKDRKIVYIPSKQ